MPIQASKYTEYTEADLMLIVVEDDEGLNHLIRKKLKKQGFQTKGALNGTEALNIIEGLDCELLLIDYKLPDLTAKELLYKLKEKLNTIPGFIIMTGFGDENIAVEMMKMGALDYIVKEADFLDVFIEKIKKAFHDICQKNKLKNTEAALKKNSDLLLETGKITRSGGWELNPDLDRFIWTSTTREILEVDAEYIPSLESVYGLFAADGANNFKKSIKNACKNSSSFDFETTITTAKNNKLWIRIIGKPELKQKKCIRLSGVFQDITIIKNKENQLKAANQLLAASKQQLIAANQQLQANEKNLKTLNLKLLASENKYRLLFENAGLGIGYFTSKGKAISFNQKAC